MSHRSLYLLLLTLVACLTQVSGLGSTCSAPLGSGSAGANDPYWLQSVKHQGLSAFNSNPGSYQVFRNVKDFGAKGDGTTDDTAAINAAMSNGGRCGQGNCPSSSLSPAVVYFPQGTYVVSSSIVDWYYTEIIGDARHPPTLKAAANFNGPAIFDVDPYLGGDSQWYTNQNNFYRSIKNLVFDTTATPANAGTTAIHWQVSQATSLYNLVFKLSTASGTNHRAINMENGSGGFMGDLVVNGGGVALDVGNQQFTVRNLTVSNAATAVKASWNWGWNFQGVTINNCQVGFDVAVGSYSDDSQQAVEAEAIIDAVVTNTPVFFRSSKSVNRLQGSIVLNNIKLNNVPTAVGIVGGATVLAGGTTTIDTWIQGNVFTGSNPTGKFTQATAPSISKASSLLDSAGRMYGRGRPTYANYALSEIISVRDQGAKGDGKTDDTAALQAVFDKYSGCKIIFFDSGTYIVSDTLKIPAGTQIYGEAWAVIMGSSSSFNDQNNPKVVVQVGTVGSKGTAEISGVIFSTRGGAAGAIVLEWNVAGSTQGSAGMWDSYVRLGGTLGTNAQSSQCPLGAPTASCYVAFLAVHLTAQSNAYFEGTWVWAADHDVEANSQGQITVYSGRGVLSESQGPVWLVGTGSEHHALYNYNLAGAANHYLGLPQTETPYWQPNPSSPAPFKSVTAYHDPVFTNEQAAWALKVTNSKNILVFAAGFYSFFQNNVGDTCVKPASCQQQVVDIDSASTIGIYSLSTVGINYQLSVNEKPVINHADNSNGLAQTVTKWTNA